MLPILSVIKIQKISINTWPNKWYFYDGNQKSFHHIILFMARGTLNFMIKDVRIFLMSFDIKVPPTFSVIKASFNALNCYVWGYWKYLYLKGLPMFFCNQSLTIWEMHFILCKKIKISIQRNTRKYILGSLVIHFVIRMMQHNSRLLKNYSCSLNN